jgi:hypothetical protein
MNEEYTVLFHIIFSLTCFCSELSSGSYIKGITRDIYFLFMAQQPIVRHCLIYAASSHSETPQHSHQTIIPPVEFGPASRASKQPQIHALDHAGTGFGHIRYMSTLSLMSVTRVSLQRQGIVVLNTDWPVQVTLYLHKLIIETSISCKRNKRLV